MTKCNWKTGLFLFFGALFLASPCLAAEDLIQYSGSNTAIAEDVKAFNRNLREVKDKSELINEARKAKKTCFNQKLIVKPQVQLLQSLVSAWGVIVDDSFWSSVGNFLDGAWELTESRWSSIDSDLKNTKDQIEYYYKGALKNAESEESKKKATEQYNKIISQYNIVKSAWEKTKEVCNKAASFDDIDGTDIVYEYTYCPTDRNGNVIQGGQCSKTYFVSDDGTMKTVVGATRGCIPLPAKLAEAKSCLFCPLFKKIFNAANVMTTNSFSATANALSIVLVIGFGIWLAFKVMVLVSSFTKQDGPKFVSEALTQAFKVLVAYLLLKNASFIYNQLLGPLLHAGMEFGMAMLFEKGSRYLNGCGGPETIKDLAGGLWPSYLYSQLECYIQAIQAEISVPQAIGSSLMCVSRHAAAGDVNIGSVTIWANVIPDVGMLIEGFIIWLFAWLLSLAFAFYLLDAVVRLGIIGALMPFLIASWPIKMTSGYTKKGWGMFMNTLFTFVFLGLVISVNVQLIMHSMSGGAGGRDAIMAALNSDEVTELKEILDIGFAGFLILIACCIFGFKLTSQASSLAGDMSGSSGEGIGNKLGGLAASAAKGAALGAGKFTWGAAKIGGNVTGITPKLRQVTDRGKAAASRFIGNIFGVGKNSGAAGGRKARAAAAAGGNGGAGTPSSRQSGNGFTINGSPQQAERVQNAQPRTGNGINPSQRPEVQRAMADANTSMHNYAGHKHDNAEAWDKYTKSEQALGSAQSEATAARTMASRMKNTPEAAKYEEIAQKAEAKYAAVQKAHSLNQQRVQETENKMNSAAVDTYVNQQKAIAMRQGKSFDEDAVRAEAMSKIADIQKDLDTIIKNSPEFN